MQTVTLNIGSVSCGGYVKNITHILEGIGGVGKAEVSPENKDTAVAFDPARTDPDAPIEVTEDGGSDAPR